MRIEVMSKISSQYSSFKYSIKLSSFFKNRNLDFIEFKIQAKYFYMLPRTYAFTFLNFEKSSM